MLMGMTIAMKLRGWFGVAVLALALLPCVAAAQTAPEAVAHRTRLILKDGSFQIVMSYQVRGQIVSYVSAERGGDREEIPASLVDWDATHAWEQQHNGEQQGPVLDPELEKEEADRASLTPEIAPDLQLPETGSALALDTFRGVPELVPLAQMGGDLNPNTAHSVVKLTLNPMASPHMIVNLKGEKSLFQMHVDTPVFYLRVGDETQLPTGGAPMVVDTHGASARKDEPSGGSASSRYVVVRVDVRTGARVLDSFSIGALGSRQQADVVETTTHVLPGGHWMTVTPKQPLLFGEYALMEVLNDRDVNTAVWDFGVHPTAIDNRDSLKPEPRRPVTLERRRVE